MKKDIDWLNNELEKVIKDVENDDISFAGKDDYDEGYIDGIRDVQSIVNQLDNQEVLSQEFIESNSVYASSDGVTEEYIHVDDLKELLVPKHPTVEVRELINKYSIDTMSTYDVKVERERFVKDLQSLLVPKHELPVIPKFVADWIEENKKKNRSLVFAITHIYDESEIGKSPKIFIWMESDDNEEVFARAWLDGYTVEEEPLYRARLKVITDEFIASYLRTQSSNAEDRLKALEIGSKYIHEDYRHLSEFTEDELKRLGIWDSGQWEVEEME